MIDVVVNTCALASHAQGRSDSDGHDYGARAAWLRDIILPRLVASPHVGRVIVAGEYAAANGYMYVPVPNRYRNCRDVPAQRHEGFAATSARVVLFLMDDHCPSNELLVAAGNIDDTTVLVPDRISYRDERSHLLNCGWNDERYAACPISYFHTHALAMPRNVVERVPWSMVPPIHTFDVVHSMWLTDIGVRHVRTQDAVYLLSACDRVPP